MEGKNLDMTILVDVIACLPRYFLIGGMQDDESEVTKATNTAGDPVGVGPLDRELTPDEFVDVLNQLIGRKRIEENQRTQLSSIRQRVRKLLYGEEENQDQLTLTLTHNLDIPSAEAYANFEEALGRMAALTHDQAPSPSGASLGASNPLRIRGLSYRSSLWPSSRFASPG